MATILSMVQDVCRRNALPVPAAITGSQDAQNIQYIGVVNQCLEDMRNRFDWQVLTQEAVFTTVATESQGDINTLAPNGLNVLLNETFFDRTLRLPLYGPLDATEWQALKALPNTGPLYQYRIRENELLFMPVPVAGHIIAFEYTSTWAVRDPISGTNKEFFTLDTDIILLDDSCFKACFEWSWKAHKGLDYAEEFRRYEAFVVDTKSADGTNRRINTANVSREIQPGIFVPAGNWLQP